MTKIFEHYYNFWQDESHPRGIWRRTSSIELYKSTDAKWEVVLDVDALGASEGESWVYKGYTIYDIPETVIHLINSHKPMLC